MNKVDQDIILTEVATFQLCDLPKVTFTHKWWHEDDKPNSIKTPSPLKRSLYHTGNLSLICQKLPLNIQGFLLTFLQDALHLPTRRR